MLCILAIRLLLAYSFGSDLGGIANPQLEVQFRQHSLEPARMPTGFYPHTHFHSWCCEVTVELFRFLRVLQSPLSKFSSVGIHKRNLLEARVVVTSYNDHLRLLSPEPVGWFSTTNFTRASEPTLSWNHYTHNPARGFSWGVVGVITNYWVVSVMGMFGQLTQSVSARIVVLCATTHSSSFTCSLYVPPRGSRIQVLSLSKGPTTSR